MGLFGPDRGWEGSTPQTKQAAASYRKLSRSRVLKTKSESASFSLPGKGRLRCNACSRGSVFLSCYTPPPIPGAGGFCSKPADGEGCVALDYPAGNIQRRRLLRGS